MEEEGLLAGLFLSFDDGDDRAPIQGIIGNRLKKQVLRVLPEVGQVLKPVVDEVGDLPLARGSVDASDGDQFFCQIQNFRIHLHSFEKGPRSRSPALFIHL